ncbi:hypothetical protein [Tichowtungia aerotolerans]|uniref:Thioredoxin-like fold domain-containing protein n=1 Tax=Tichowtungia aerotolerans TaxID=2697043 RepID=A0A6P1M6P6_9BACT|nr:hypothetical protein [Tichowtungia aerotolerans]QHI68683.1 hypothetical protein GT409_04215 [Tichowtungia aerotolerans]
MKKIHVDICSDPTCYREAVLLFKELNAVLGAALKEQIVLTGIPHPHNGRLAPPCVQVNNRLIARATAGEVKEAIQEALEPHRMVA